MLNQVENPVTATDNLTATDVLFVQHYANVNKHSFAKEERALNRNPKKKIGGVTVDKEDCKDFTLGELKKSDTREEADRFNLRTAKKPESHDLCLIEHQMLADPF